MNSSSVAVGIDAHRMPAQCPDLPQRSLDLVVRWQAVSHAETPRPCRKRRKQPAETTPATTAETVGVNGDSSHDKATSPD